MKTSTINRRWFRFGLISLAIVLSPTFASAEKSAAWKDLATRSNAKGFNSSRLPVLVRKPGIGNDAMGQKVIDLLASKFGLGASDVQKAAEPKGLRIESPGWNVRVSDDGNTVRVRMGGDQHVFVPAIGQASYAQIESAARKFIGNELVDFIKLAPNEALIPLGTRYVHSGGYDIHASTSEPVQTKQWSMAFGRTIDGEAVVGGGAIVAVIFRADNTVAGFDFDWPQYEKSAVQVDTMATAAIRARGRGLDKRGSQIQSREMRFECGLFDPGGKSTRRRLEYIQPACFQTLVASNAKSPGTEGGVAVAIPAAQTPMNDAKWSEAAALCSQPGQACRAIP